MRGYLLVIFSNQAGIGARARARRGWGRSERVWPGRATTTRAKTLHEKISRFAGFIRAVGVPMFVFAATGGAAKRGGAADDDPYRKPSPGTSTLARLPLPRNLCTVSGMWRFLVEHYALAPDMRLSFFVGDAAGRPRDHSDSDRVFAARAQLAFFTEDVAFTRGFQPPVDDDEEEASAAVKT